MAESSSAFDYLPETLSYSELARAAESCRGCGLYKNATQIVFGEGDVESGVVFVGEQPGDEEDIRGRPFVGPAGRLLDRALADVGIDRDHVLYHQRREAFQVEAAG